MSRQKHAILLVADISGYTKFMKQHQVSLNHAKQIVVRLIKSIISASKPPLTVAELEGDAVFFYAPCEEKDIKKTSELVKKQVLQLFSSFKNELFIMRKMEICECSACINAGDLKLKQVIHTGVIELEKINRSQKLFGVDVIIVHRMLKNSVPSNEYIMMTNNAYENFSGFYGLTPNLFKENFDGIGEVDTQVFYAEDIYNLPDVEQTEPDKPTFTDRMLWKMRLVPHTILGFLNLNNIKGDFKNIPV